MLLELSPVEYEHVKAQPGPGQSGDHGSIERLFVGEHPGPLRHGEVEVVPVSVPEEDVLQGGAASLVSFSEGNLDRLDEDPEDTSCPTCFLGKHLPA